MKVLSKSESAQRWAKSSRLTAMCGRRVIVAAGRRVGGFLSYTTKVKPAAFSALAPGPVLVLLSRAVKGDHEITRREAA